MPDNQIHFVQISPTGKIKLISSLSDAIASIKDGGYLWLDYFHPTKEDLFHLVEPFGLHPLSIEDCTDQEQIAKLENFPTYSFMIFNTYEKVDDVLSLGELDVMLGKNFLITVSTPSTVGENMLKVIERSLGADTSNLTQGPSYLLHLILDKVVDRKFEAIEALEEDLDHDEETIMTDLSGFDPSTLTDSRRDLLTIRRSLFHEREIVGKIIRGDSSFFPEKSILYFRDIYDHLSKYYEMSESARDLVTSLMEMYLSLLNNKMTRAANQTNAIMRRLTLITTIFMPLTLISGIGGMSEFTMMTGGESNWRIAYLFLMVAMMIIAIINYIFLKRLEKKSADLDY